MSAVRPVDELFAAVRDAYVADRIDAEEMERAMEHARRCPQLAGVPCGTCAEFPYLVPDHGVRVQQLMKAQAYS